MTFEDRLRKRLGPRPKDVYVHLSFEERDAVADAVEALRDVSAYSVLQHYGPYLVQPDVMEKLNRGLARLDAA